MTSADIDFASPKSTPPWGALLVRSLFFALVLLGVAIFSAEARAQTAQWVKQMGTGGIGNGVSTDAAGNAYAAGTISNPGLFDNLAIPCHASDIFVAKYDGAGVLIWATVGGGELLDQANDIATDADGNSYVVGAIQTNGVYPTAQFGPITLTGHGDYDWLIAKYDVAGNVVWAKNAGSAQGDIARSVALDGKGNVYVSGFFSGTMTVEGTTITSAGNFDVFLAKYMADGTLVWLKRAGGTGSDMAHGLKVDGAGNVVLVGQFQNTASFDGHAVTSAGLGNAFVAKYDAAGNNLWVRSGGSTTSFAADPARAIAIDGANNYYITGDYTGVGTFDGLSVSSTGQRDVFVAKYNANGAIQWLHHAGGPRAEEGHSIGVDAAGNSFVSGFLGSGPGVVFDQISLPPRGNEYIFLAKYDAAGVVQSVKQYAAGVGQDVHVLETGRVYVSGGASKSSAGNEFDQVSLLYNDRGGFLGAFDLNGGVRAPEALSAVSRKVHPGVGVFDLNLPLDGTAGVECRSGGSGGNYQVAVTFAAPVSVSGVSVASADGQAHGSVIVSSAVVIVDLSGVGNGQTIGITLNDVTLGTSSGNVFLPLTVLIGDTNGNGAVTASDIAQTRASAGQAVTGANFYLDVNASGGTINSTDVSMVKSLAGTTVP